MMEEKPKRGHRSDSPENPCPICGDAAFTWGITVGDRPGGRVYFRPEGAGWGGGIQMIGRACNTCGNVQLFLRRPLT
jgi:hypothetical protein